MAAGAAQHSAPKGDAGTAVDLPPVILERLLASRIVPLDAKLKAIESWRREVAESRDPQARELERRLAAAYRSLQFQRLKAPASALAGWFGRWRGLLWRPAPAARPAMATRPIFPEL
jgi:hypothetical protein